VVVDDKIALVGDAMFGIFPGTVFPPFSADVGQMIDSWGKLPATNCRLFLPAHGTVSSRRLVLRNYEKWSARFKKKNDRGINREK